ncbi:MAG TPA: HEAT repeat domain-containing protein, partial [Methanolinea sp.]|nr:HEAT repeat domain-containing protein [Methanolinea sp.]
FSPLLLVLETGSPAARKGAAIALGKVEDPAVMEPLLSALSDPDEGVRSAVIEALAGLGEGVHSRVLAHIQGLSPGERDRVFQSLREATNPRFIEGFLPVLSMADEGVREVILSLVREGGRVQQGGKDPAPGA